MDITGKEYGGLDITGGVTDHQSLRLIMKQSARNLW